MARRPIVSPTGKPVVLAALHPNVGIEVQYRRKLERLIDEMNNSVLYWVTAYYRKHPAMAEDGPTEMLLKAIRGLGRRWLRRFDQAARELADHFATAAHRRADGALEGILRRGGFTVQFTPSAAVRDVIPAIVAENVSLIKSIQSQHFAQIEQQVMRSVSAGRDLKQLTDDLQQTFGVTRRRAAVIAKDQNGKATAMISRARQLEIGVQKAVWLHSHGGHPRQSHIDFSGQEYDVAKGAYLYEPSKKKRIWTWPGHEINCRCVTKLVIPGITT